MLLFGPVLPRHIDPWLIVDSTSAMKFDNLLLKFLARFRLASIAAAVTFIIFQGPSWALAFTADSLHLGVGVYAESLFGNITKSSDGSTATIGPLTYPLFLKYDFQVTDAWYLSPQILYTPIGRESAGGSTSTTILQLNLPIGFNLKQWIETTLDWQFGLGLNRRSIKGAGGTDTLLNGSTPTSYIRPSKTVTTTNLTFLLGSSLTYGSSRFSLDFVFEGLLSEKRTYSALVGYSYQIW